MPIPKPNKGEKEPDFISRCMGNNTMKKDYPDQKQRLAVCYSSWRQKKGEKMEDKKEDVKRDEDGHIIVAENVKVTFGGFINENVETDDE